MFEGSFVNDSWAKKDNRLNTETFSQLSAEWTHDTPIRSDYERRMALVEIDVLTSMALGLTCDELKLMYSIQFPVLNAYEQDTWYDSNGRIIFTNNRSLSGVGLSRVEFEEIKDMTTGSCCQVVMDDTLGESTERTLEYTAPFTKCDREKDYEEIWTEFTRRFN